MPSYLPLRNFIEAAKPFSCKQELRGRPSNHRVEPTLIFLPAQLFYRFIIFYRPFRQSSVNFFCGGGISQDPTFLSICAPLLYLFCSELLFPSFCFLKLFSLLRSVYDMLPRSEYCLSLISTGIGNIRMTLSIQYTYF